MSDELKSSDSQPPEAGRAAVLTYVRESWGNQNGAVSADQIKAARAAISGNTPPATNLPK
jgi:mono/diheme cytochrome c family protein